MATARGGDNSTKRRAGSKKSIHSPRYDEIVRLLREERVAAGLTQTELSRRLKRRQTYVSKVELSERRIDLLEWLEWCEACGAEPEGFLRRLHERQRQAT